MTGTLFIVATPIGNLADITDRARQVLGSVAVIAAEDTRHSGRLLAHLGIRSPLISYHDHSDESRLEEIVGRLSNGEDVALICDAGTPLISDPGYSLVSRALEAEANVVPIPGCSAVTCLLSAAGMSTSGFTFVGFLPAREGARKSRLEELRHHPYTLIIYESCHRIGDSIATMITTLGGHRRVCIGRELTKLHEQIWRGSLKDAAIAIADKTIPDRGEFALCIAPAAQSAPDAAETEALIRELLTELAPSRAARLAARLSGVPRKTCYEIATQLADDSTG